MVGLFSPTTIEILIGVLGVLLLVAMVLGYRLFHDPPLPRQRRIRVGVFFERDRVLDEAPWPEFPPKPEQQTLQAWPDKTQEYPTQEKRSEE